MKSKIENTDITVGAKIKEERVAKGWSRQQLAEQINITHQQLQKYETGINRVSAGKLWVIAQSLNKPLEYFFDGNITEDTNNHSRMCIELSRSFLRIKNPMYQYAINQLVKTISENQ